MGAEAQVFAAKQYSEGFPLRYSLRDAWTCTWEDLADYQVSPVSIAGDDLPSLVASDTWLLPVELFSANRRAPGVRLIDFAKAVPEGWEGHEAEGIKRRIKRIALLDGSLTLRINGRTSSSPTPATWVAKTKCLIQAARHSIEFIHPDETRSSCPDGPTLFAGLSPEVFRALQKAFPAWNSACIPRLNGLFASGLMDDWPAPDVSAIKHQKRQNSKADQPFSDTAFTEIVRAALWLCGIQRDVVRAYIELKDIVATADGRWRRAEVWRYRRECARAWSSPALQDGTPFAYELSLSGLQNRTTSYGAWPLDTVDGIRDLLWCCQTANAVLILAATGMRIGELTGLKLDALTQNGGRMYIRGASFKDTDAPLGQARMWPLPRIASSAIEGQTVLVGALGGRSALWLSLAGDKCVTGVPNLDIAVTNFGRRVALLHGKPLGEFAGRLTPHRFRYTVARLVALSLTNASQVLFDVLGHDDVEVTLGYAHRDPELLEDINKVRREVRAVRVEGAFRGAEQNGGGAAPLLRQIKAEMLARFGKEELDTEDLGEAAKILGEVELVRPGVFCTAQPLERGACSSSLGLRDFASCTSSCMHHLELAAKRQDRKLALEQILNQIGDADRGTRVFLQGQVLASLIAFDGLIEEYASDPRLPTALHECDGPTWEALPESLRRRLTPLLKDSQ